MSETETARNNDENYIKWLHQLTRLLYDDGVILSYEDAKLIREYFDNGMPAAHARNAIVKAITSP